MTPRLKPLLGVSRAPFLLLPVALVAAGAAASAYEGALSWRRTLLALLGLVAAHAGVNALNEASDMQTGIDLATERTPFSGGSGTLPAGAMSVRGAYAWGICAAAVAAAVGVYFLVTAGRVLLPVLVLGLIAIAAYTHLLARIGLGELFAGLGLGALPVLGTSLVADGHAGAATLGAAVPAFLMTFNLLLLNEFPDEEADRRGGRRNLVILLGRRRAARIYAAAVLLAPASIGAAVAAGALPPLALVAALATLLALPGLRWAFTSVAEPVPLPALGGNVAWNLVGNLALAAMLAAAKLL